MVQDRSDQIAEWIELTNEEREARVKIASIAPEAKDAAREAGLDPVLDLSSTGPDFPRWAFI